MVVIGLGYVGLPLAQAAVRAGLAVVGFDVPQDVVAGINASVSDTDDLSDSDLAEMVSPGFTAVTDSQTTMEPVVASSACPHHCLRAPGRTWAQWKRRAISSPINATPRRSRSPSAFAAKALRSSSATRVWDAAGWRVSRSPDLKRLITDSDLVILLRNHEHYDLETLVKSAQNVLDTRGVITPGHFRHRL